jgi:hypothetical protein
VFLRCGKQLGAGIDEVRRRVHQPPRSRSRKSNTYKT